jgi:hypothetical protein
VTHDPTELLRLADECCALPAYIESPQDHMELILAVSDELGVSDCKVELALVLPHGKGSWDAFVALLPDGWHWQRMIVAHPDGKSGVGICTDLDSTWFVSDGYEPRHGVAAILRAMAAQS